MGGDSDGSAAKSQVALRGKRAWEGCVSFAFFRVSRTVPAAQSLLAARIAEALTGEVKLGTPLHVKETDLFPFCLQLAVITQGIAARVAQGNASSAKAATQSKIMPIMGNLAANHIRDYADVGSQSKL